MARMLREFSAMPEERRTDGYAARIIDLWSKRLARGAAPLLMPTIAAAIRAGPPWLSYQCPGCTMVGEADAEIRPPPACVQLKPNPDAPQTASTSLRFRTGLTAFGG